MTFTYRETNGRYRRKNTKITKSRILDVSTQLMKDRRPLSAQMIQNWWSNPEFKIMWVLEEKKICIILLNKLILLLSWIHSTSSTRAKNQNSWLTTHPLTHWKKKANSKIRITAKVVWHLGTRYIPLIRIWLQIRIQSFMTFRMFIRLLDQMKMLMQKQRVKKSLNIKISHLKAETDFSTIQHPGKTAWTWCNQAWIRSTKMTSTSLGHLAKSFKRSLT